MNKYCVCLIACVFFVQPVAAAPAYERIIDTHGLSLPQSVFIAVPESVTTISPLSDVRVVRGNVVVAQKSTPEKQGEIGGVVRNVTMCSVEGRGKALALHDGSIATSVRPDPLVSSSMCVITFSFASPTRVSFISIDTDESLQSLIVTARGSNGAYRQIGESANANELSFSSVVADELKVTIGYHTVPNIREIRIEGTQPARILFRADLGAVYSLVYGDPQPRVIPANQSLFATNTTPFANLMPEQILGSDTDKDGIVDAKDNCPTISNPDQRDRDNDGIGDACDNAPDTPNYLQNDQDRDGVGDATDNCPTIFNPDQRDSDLNGIGDVCDDLDHDGIINSKDNCPGIGNLDQKDSNGDGVGDVCQLDRDSDGIPDSIDNCRSMPNPEQKDRDSDGIGDACDSCPDVYNPGQEDVNSNNIGDACEGALLDPDSDGIANSRDNCASVKNPDQKDTDHDGVGDACDNCPTIQNVDQANSRHSGPGDACSDVDGDGILVEFENCPAIYNPDQLDKNNNGIGDACEDSDHDGVLNGVDNCRYADNADQRDLDRDGIGDACDPVDNRLSEQHPWVMWIGMTAIVLILLSIAIRMTLAIRNDQRR